MKKSKISLLVFCFAFIAQAYAFDKTDLGNGVVFFESLKAFALGFYEKSGDKYPEDSKKQLDYIDLDGDGLNDEIYIIAYDRNTRFNSNVKVVDLFDSKANVNGWGAAEAKNFPPKQPTYAMVVILSSCKNKIYVLQNSTFFPRKNQTYALPGASKVDKITNYNYAWPMYRDIILSKKLSPKIVKGDMLEMAGCISLGKICYDDKPPLVLGKIIVTMPANGVTLLLAFSGMASNSRPYQSEMDLVTRCLVPQYSGSG
jgi:hypothetical protein